MGVDEHAILGERLARIETQLEQMPDSVATRIEHTDRTIRQLVQAVEKDVAELADRQRGTDASVKAIWSKLDPLVSAVERITGTLDTITDRLEQHARIADVTKLDERLAAVERGWQDADGVPLPKQVAANRRLLDRSRWTLIGAAGAGAAAGGGLLTVIIQALGG